MTSILAGGIDRPRRRASSPHDLLRTHERPIRRREYATRPVEGAPSHNASDCTTQGDARWMEETFTFHRGLDGTYRNGSDTYEAFLARLGRYDRVIVSAFDVDANTRVVTIRTKRLEEHTERCPWCDESLWTQLPGVTGPTGGQQPFFGPPNRAAVCWECSLVEMEHPSYRRAHELSTREQEASHEPMPDGLVAWVRARRRGEPDSQVRREAVEGAPSASQAVSTREWRGGRGHVLILSRHAIRFDPAVGGSVTIPLDEIKGVTIERAEGLAAFWAWRVRIDAGVSTWFAFEAGPKAKAEAIAAEVLAARARERGHR